MSIIGEAILMGSVEFVIHKLASSELLSFARHERIHGDLKKWKNMLMKINAVLEDAEEKQILNQFVKRWLIDLQNLAHHVEDILDKFATMALERKLSHESESSTSMVQKLIPANFNPHAVKFNFKMGPEMKITERLQEIAAQKNNLDLRENSIGTSNKVRDRRLPTTSLSEAHVYGREKDEAAIVELLLKDEGIEDGMSVIPIVRIGGVGKTTLAQNVYNNARVKSHFDFKAWACVSDDLDVITVTKTILKFIAPKSHDSSDLNKLQVESKGKLLGKKFLFVLDDIWNENPNKWTTLLRPFESNSPGGKIIVTTRSNYISSMVGTCQTYPLEGLSNDDCLSIFTYHSLGIEGFNGHPNWLREITEKIVKRCRGLPLVAKTLGGLLHNSINCNDWEHILNSKIWNLPTSKSGIMPALRLSNHYLPPHLKPCFAYCSLLPKDYEHLKEEIILL